MKAIVGLGNPGKDYQDTRHNIGFKVIDAIADDERITIKKNSYNSLIGIGKVNTEQIILVKPLTFMNLSGQAVKAVIEAKQLDLADILIICDDVNLPIGNIRLRSIGSDGGHNGLKSISGVLATKNYPRLRVGIGKDVASDGSNLASYVLSKPSKKANVELEAAISKAKDAVYAWLEKDIDTCMNSFNEKVKD
ncbi:MAG: aminoacyl-tRNA hydrolase [Candidatus Kappaea frigidicola]|nr:aminoacyl-tRNA hydrolase [Candidatus Kappaea frigidicola]